MVHLAIRYVCPSICKSSLANSSDTTGWIRLKPSETFSINQKFVTSYFENLYKLLFNLCVDPQAFYSKFFNHSDVALTCPIYELVSNDDLIMAIREKYLLLIRKDFKVNAEIKHFRSIFILLHGQTCVWGRMWGRVS